MDLVGDVVSLWTLEAYVIIPLYLTGGITKAYRADYYNSRKWNIPY
jgi:hypothetical protein